MLIATRTALWCALHSKEPIQLVEGETVDVTGWYADSVTKLLASGYVTEATKKNPVTEDKAINPVVETKVKKEKKIGGK
jgi:hypothetical protein